MTSCAEVSTGVETRVVSLDPGGWIVREPTGIAWFACRTHGIYARGPRDAVNALADQHLHGR